MAYYLCPVSLLHRLWGVQLQLEHFTLSWSRRSYDLSTHSKESTSRTFRAGIGRAKLPLRCSSQPAQRSHPPALRASATTNKQATSSWPPSRSSIDICICSKCSRIRYSCTGTRVPTAVSVPTLATRSSLVHVDLARALQLYYSCRSSTSPTAAVDLARALLQL